MPDPYFTAIEEHYRALKGRSSVMLSPADWRLVAVFKCSGIPVAIVLRGIDEAFQDFASRREPRGNQQSGILQTSDNGSVEAEQAEDTNTGGDRGAEGPTGREQARILTSRG